MWLIDWKCHYTNKNSMKEYPYCSLSSSWEEVLQEVMENVLCCFASVQTESFSLTYWVVGCMRIFPTAKRQELNKNSWEEGVNGRDMRQAAIWAPLHWMQSLWQQTLLMQSNPCISLGPAHFLLSPYHLPFLFFIGKALHSVLIVFFSSSLLILIFSSVQSFPH